MLVIKRNGIRLELKKNITEEGFLRLFLANEEKEEIIEISLDPKLEFVRQIIEDAPLMYPEKKLLKERLTIVKTFHILNGEMNTEMYDFHEILKENGVIRDTLGMVHRSELVLSECPIVSTRIHNLRDMEEDDFSKVIKS